MRVIIYLFSLQQDAQYYNILFISEIMFRFNSINPDKLQANLNVLKIRGLLSKTLAQIKAESKVLSQNPDSPLKKRAQSNTEPESMQEIHRNLKKGYLVLKHSRNTKQPHTKMVYLSEDNKYLCWKSIDRQDQKRFPISSIIRIVKQGYKNYLVDTINIKNSNCCLIIFSEIRNLQIETVNEYEADILKYQLCRTVKHSQEMSQNYLYNQE